MMSARILIADDYDDNRELLGIMLRDASYTVQEARDGQECLRLAQERPPDLILIDLSMPKLDGWALFRELKADARTRNIPCVAATANAALDRRRALAAGFVDYLPKPFRAEALLAVVKNALLPRAAKASLADSRARE